MPKHACSIVCCLCVLCNLCATKTSSSTHADDTLLHNMCCLNHSSSKRLETKHRERLNDQFPSAGIAENCHACKYKTRNRTTHSHHLWCSLKICAWEAGKRRNHFISEMSQQTSHSPKIADSAMMPYWWCLIRVSSSSSLAPLCSFSHIYPLNL